jgi:hypothetical protein
LRNLFSQARAECGKDITLVTIQAGGEFEGRTEWRDENILIGIKDGLDNDTVEYVAAHELCHALQLVRGFPIASGRVDEPGSVAIATRITDLVYDSSADAMAVQFELPMASSFEGWLRSTRLLEVLKRPRNGRRYGTNWIKVWEKLKETRVCRQLGLKLPSPPKEFWTLWVAFDFANTIQRALNFGLTIGVEMRGELGRLPLVSKVVNDLLTVVSPGGIVGIEESLSRLVGILDYIMAAAGHIYIHRPLTDEIYVEGKWKSRSKQVDADWSVIRQFVKDARKSHRR